MTARRRTATAHRPSSRPAVGVLLCTKVSFPGVFIRPSQPHRDGGFAQRRPGGTDEQFIVDRDDAGLQLIEGREDATGVVDDPLADRRAGHVPTGSRE